MYGIHAYIGVVWGVNVGICGTHEVSGSLLPQGVGGSDPQQKMDYPFLTLMMH